MPGHVHLLLSEPVTDPLPKAIQALRLSVSTQATLHPFWQPRFYDVNVFTTKKRLEKLDYMHRNPSPAASSSSPNTGRTPAAATI